MLTRYWQWTSAPATPSAAGLPFGPLRYRAWTSAPSVVTPAASGLPFGPLRFRAWTSGAAVTPPAVDHGGGFPIRRPPPDDRLERARLARDDELLLWVVSGAASAGLLD